MLFQWLLFVQVLTHDEMEEINGCERLKCHGLPVVLYPRGGLWKYPSDHETWSIWCHVGILVDITPILHSHAPLVPRAQCEANLDRLRLFHQHECLKWIGHGLSVSCVKWPFVCIGRPYNVYILFYFTKIIQLQENRNITGAHRILSRAGVGWDWIHDRTMPQEKKNKNQK